MKRKVCVVTGSRADYGHLRPLIMAIKKDKQLQLQLVATGMHLSSHYGLTYKEIERDGFKIDERVNILLKGDSASDVCSSMGQAVAKFTRVYQRLRPDVVIVLGDRFEILSAVICAHVSGIVVGHLHGGEVTQGAFDEAFRHAISKMSQWHFTSTQEYRRRVIQLGESPNTVFHVGAVGLDNLKSLKLLSKNKLERNLQFTFGQKNLLVTFHPVTLESRSETVQLNHLLNVLEGLKDTKIIITKSNADTGGRTINRMIDRFAKRNKGRVKAFSSLGQVKYWSAIQYVDGVVGNSSSGIIEVPSFKKPTVNIGDRQKGRIRSKSTIDCAPDKSSIKAAINKMYSPQFRKSLRSLHNPYGDGQTAQRILKVLKSRKLPELKKKFYDLS